MITTAGKGPEPSGLDSSTGICSEVPLGVVVVIDEPERAAPQPLVATTQSARAIAASR
jgi:hypothetical protein